VDGLHAGRHCRCGVQARHRFPSVAGARMSAVAPPSVDESVFVHFIQMFNRSAGFFCFCIFP
jgi:hypothetical protein